MLCFGFMLHCTNTQLRGGCLLCSDQIFVCLSIDTGWNAWFGSSLLLKLAKCSLLFLQVIRMMKRKRRWSKNLAKQLIGLRNVWEIKLLVCKFQTDLALHLVFWRRENLQRYNSSVFSHRYCFFIQHRSWKLKKISLFCFFPDYSMILCRSDLSNNLLSGLIPVELGQLQNIGSL